VRQSDDLSEETRYLDSLIAKLSRLYAHVPCDVVRTTVRQEFERVSRTVDRKFVNVFIEQASKIRLAELNLTAVD